MRAALQTGQESESDKPQRHKPHGSIEYHFEGALDLGGPLAEDPMVKEEGAELGGGQGDDAGHISRDLKLIRYTKMESVGVRSAGRQQHLPGWIARFLSLVSCPP